MYKIARQQVEQFDPENATYTESSGRSISKNSKTSAQNPHPGNLEKLITCLQDYDISADEIRLSKNFENIMAQLEVKHIAWKKYSMKRIVSSNSQVNKKVQSNRADKLNKTVDRLR